MAGQTDHEQLRRALAGKDQALREQSQLIAAQAQTIAALESKLEQIHFQMAKLLRRQFGRSSEQVPGQQSLDLDLNDTVVASGADDEAEPDNGTDEDCAASRSQGRRGQRGGRLTIPDTIERRRVVIEPPPEALVDEFGRPLHKLRENIQEVLELIPARFICREIVRPVYGRRDEPDVIPVVAEPPPQIIPGGLAGDSLLLSLLCDKFALHHPFYRQQGRFAQTGVHLSRSSMVNWLKATVAFFKPVVEAIAAETLASHWLAIDDTTIKRLAPGKGSTPTRGDSGAFWGQTLSWSATATRAPGSMSPSFWATGEARSSLTITAVTRRSIAMAVAMCRVGPISVASSSRRNAMAVINVRAR
jgi:transposase